MELLFWLETQDWMRIGAFSFDSPLALLTEKLTTSARIPKEDSINKMLESHGSFVLKNIKTGIWIAGTWSCLDQPVTYFFSLISYDREMAYIIFPHF